MIRVLFFGHIADRIGRRELQLEAHPGMTLADAVRATGCHEIRPLLFAVNRQQVDDTTTPVTDGDEIAIMPPFSGG